MGLFSFLFKDHRRSQDYDYEEEEWEKTSLLQPFSSPDPSEDVSDATMMIPRIRKRTISSNEPATEEKIPMPEPAAPAPDDEMDDEMDDLMNAISSAVQRKTAKPSRSMAGTQSMLSNVASLVDEREAQLEEDATAVLPRTHAAAEDATVVVKQSEPIVTTDTMGDVTRAVFPSKPETSEPAAAAEADEFEATAVLTKEPEAEAPEEVAVEEPVTVSEEPEVAAESTEMPEESADATVEEVNEQPEETPIEEEPSVVEDTAAEEAVPVSDVVDAELDSSEDAADEAVETEEPTALEMAEVVEAEPVAEALSAEESEPTAEAVVEDTADVTEDEAKSPVEETPAEEIAIEEPVEVEETPVEEDTSEEVPEAEDAPEDIILWELSEPVAEVVNAAEATPTDEPAEEAVAEQPIAPASIVLPDSDEEDDDEDDEPAWGAHWVSPDAAMLSDSDEYFRLTWKLKGTGKKRRLRAISECVKGQPVYITCGPDDSECVVITEDGEEIGRLTEQDSMVYHTLVSSHPHNMYIKKIRSSQFEKTKVKILVIVHRGSSNAAENGIISDS